MSPQFPPGQDSANAPGIVHRLRDMAGQCMALDADLIKAERAMGTNWGQMIRYRLAESFLEAAHECLVEAAGRLACSDGLNGEISVEVKR